MQIANLVVSFTGNLTHLQNSFSQVTRQAQSFSDRMTALGTALTASLTLPLVGLGAAAFNAGVRLDAMKASLTAIMGSAAAAERELANLREVARLPGLGFEEAVRGSTALQTVGFSAKLAREALTGFGNAVAITGGGRYELDRVITQLTQMASAGKVLTQDLRPIIQTAPAVGRALFNAFGTINAAKIEALGLSTEEFMTRFISAVNELPRTAGGAKTAMENLREGWGDLMRALSQSVIPAAVTFMRDVTKRLEEWAAAFSLLSPEQQQFRLKIIAWTAVIGPAIVVVGTLARTLRALTVAFAINSIVSATAAWFALIPAITTAADAFVLLRMAVVGVTTSLGPLGIAVAILGAVAFAFWKTGESARQAAAKAQFAAQEFRAALAGMDNDTLGAGVQYRSRALPVIQGQIDETARQLRAARDALSLAESAQPRPSDFGAGKGAALPPTADLRAARTEVDRLSSRYATLTEQYERNRRELREMGDQLNRNTSTLGQQNTFSPPSVDADATDKLRGARETVEQFVRELQTVQKFAGAISIDFLPDNIAEKIRDFDSLRERADRLADALQKMGAAAPREGFAALDALRAQVAIARREIDALAENFTRALQEMGARTVNTQVNVAVNPLFSGTIRASVDNSLERFGASLNATGSLLGNLGTPLGLAGAGLLFLRESATQAGRTLLSAFEQASSAGGQFVSNMQNTLSQSMKAGASLGQAAPQAIAFAAAMEVATGFFQALAPAMDALTLPLRMMGEILSTLMIPVLKIIFPIFKVVAIVGSYLGETIARVVAAILNAVGGFVKGLGKVINAITPFANPGNPLVKAGEALQRTAGSFSDAANEMREKRKELQNLTFDSALNKAANAADKLSESLSNVPPLFDLALRRMQASRGMTPGPVTLRTPAMPSGSVLESGGTRNTSLHFNINEGAFQSVSSGDPREQAAAFLRYVIPKLSTASDPEARRIADALRLVGV